MIDDKKIEAAKEEIYEDRFLLNGEEVVFDNDEKEEIKDKNASCITLPYRGIHYQWKRC